MDLIEKLARNVVVTGYEKVPSEAVEIEKADILDILGCLVAGATAPGCSAVVDLAREMEGKEESTIMMHGGKVPAEYAALANATMARALDFEACGAGACHGSAPTVATAFAMSEKLGGVSGKDFLSALVVGIDLIARLYSSWNVLYHGWDPAVVCSIFGTTAIAGKLLGLDEGQMVNAFGIALNQAGGTWQNNVDGSLMVRLNTGLVARGGIFSARLAQKGITGVKQVMQGKWGFYNLFAQGEYNAEALTSGLGERFHNVDTAFKMYPSCYGTHVVTEVTLDLVGEHDIRPQDVTEIIVGISGRPSAYFLSRPFEMGEVPQVYAQFSFQYTVANALLRRSALKQHFTEEFIRDPQVQALVQKVRVEEMFEWTAQRAPNRVEIRTKDGKSYSKELVWPLGFPQRPVSKERIVEKFRDNVAYSAGTSLPLLREKGEGIIALIDRLEELDNVNQVVDLVV